MAAEGSRRCFKTAGQIYYGDVQELEDGTCLRHGLGLQIITAETVTGETVIWGRYQGAWRKGQMTGSGVYRWSDGSVYEGCWLNGRPHGHGRLTWPEGSVYDGSWLEGEMHGQGTMLCGFDKLELHGTFYRNCLRDHRREWVDQVKQRDIYRLEHLSIGSFPEARPSVSRCQVHELRDKLTAIMQEPPHLIPLVIATQSCCVEAGCSPAPLGCLERMDGGCTGETSIHIGHAASEKLRKREHRPLFRNAIQAALLESRPLTLIWGDDAARPDGNPQETPQEQDVESVDPVPDSWSLNNFFEPLVLPPDIFDLQHFHGSGMADEFLPAEKQGLVPKPPVKAEGDSEDATPAHPPIVPPPVVHLLRLALVSMKTIPDSASDEMVCAHAIRRFSASIPLHRVSILVVS